MHTRTDRAAYKILTDAKAVPKEALERIWNESESSESGFYDTLRKSGLIPETRLLQLLSESTGNPCVNLKETPVEKSVFEKVPVKFAWYYKFFPFKAESGKITLAVSRLLDIHVLDEIRFGLGYEVETVFAPEKDIEDMLKRHYGLGAETVDKIMQQQTAQSPSAPAEMPLQEVEDIEKLAEAASVIQLVNQIILEAYRKRASDIHFEPFRGKIRLRYRIDGVLHEAPVPGDMKKFYPAILSRIKIMANLNIVERRLPQDGKLRVKTQDQTLDLRVSCIPTPHGESMVVRILPGKIILDLDRLGFEPRHLQLYKDLLKRPNGILFLTGPTGSGKSTSLYAGLNTINTLERKVITIEDPVEYEMDGISQIQVAPEIGLTFSRGLRSVLRHDPDVMMVGEVRDLETADIAIRVALTGHLILSTLHTNDAASGVTRLLDIGVEPYLVASSVIAFMAQRLVRLICPQCKSEDRVTLSETRRLIFADLGIPFDENGRIQRGRGCDHCNGTGYQGRVALHEILVMNEEIRKLIMSRATSEAIKQKAVETGMTTLRQDGWAKVLQGVTTPDEILEVTPADQARTPPQEIRTAVPIKEAVSAKTGPETRSQAPAESSAFQERRKYKRVATQTEMTFRFVNYPAGDEAVPDFQSRLEKIEFEGTTANLSAGGMLFVTSNRFFEELNKSLGDLLKVGLTLDLRLAIPDGAKPVECLGRILRITRFAVHIQREGKFYYHVSILFLVINSVDRQRLEKYCEAHGLDEKV
ncbi:MAG: Flp pilus assembly complex ATPase component TadA [Candidatus Omnitrophica bacterium]|nr:Flp pilus assembly complex ATPase component TadA [Candidatus Omnitrophota bacterium]